MKQHIEKDGIPRSFLCQTCQSIFTGQRKDKAPGAPTEADLNQTWDELELSAQQGCQLCWLRFNQVSDNEKTTLSRDQSIRYGYWESRVGNGIAFDYTRLGGEKPLTHSISVVPGEQMKLSPVITVLRRMEQNEHFSNADPVHEVWSSSNSFASFTTASMWLHDCLTNHEICRRASSSSRVLPTRLVDVGPEESVQPRLCSSKDLPVQTPYLTLSHCWGGLVFLRLLNDNIALFKERIPVNELSKTFKDAMEFTKRLGLRYIWIDSLCIVQDSKEDWAFEAARMGDVYHNSCCNIAATAAPNGLAGCFSSRSLIEVEPCRVETTWKGITPSLVYCHDLDILDHNLDASPLKKRAWVVQEMTLAPRILHFAQRQMFWECLERRACESFPDKIPNNTASKQSLDPSASNHLFSPLPPDKTLHWLSSWQKQVQAYSETELTYPQKDKLVAISGLAKKLGPPEQYLAGLWKPYLPDQLLWVVQDKDDLPKPRRRTTEYRAPSWSWASMDGIVYMPDARWMKREDHAMEYIDADIKTTSGDPTGQVESAVLRVRGVLACLRLRIEFEELEDEPRFDPKKGLVFDKVDSSKPKTRIKRYYLVRGEEPKEQIPTTIFDTAMSSLLENITSKPPTDLLAGCGVFMDDWEPRDGALMYCFVVRKGKSPAGLVLEPTDQRGQYRRCGKFHINDWPRKESLEDFGMLCKLSSRFVDSRPELYEERGGFDNDGFTQYVISIV